MLPAATGSTSEEIRAGLPSRTGSQPDDQEDQDDEGAHSNALHIIRLRRNI